MQILTKDKPPLPILDQVLPDGLIVNRQWLYEWGYSRSNIDFYIRSGKLERVGRGVYRRPGPPLKWQHLFYSLQEMGMRLHIGGRSALDLQGYAHFLNPEGVPKEITLFGPDKLPAWVEETSPVQFSVIKERCFDMPPANALSTIPFGHWDWELKISAPELALLELVSTVKEVADFKMVDRYFESVTVLHHKRLNVLLQNCGHIRTKRLFLWFAKKHRHAWFDTIDIDTIDLGSGKREIIKGGVLDRDFLITVPRDMGGDADEFF